MDQIIVPRKRGRPRGSQNKSRIQPIRDKRFPGQLTIAHLGGDWQARELVHDPKLRDSRGHLKAAEIRRLDRAAS